MVKRLEQCNPLPSASELTVAPPPQTIIDTASLDEIPPTRLFELKEILNCQILYTEFISYLRARVCSENLICLRMIMIFEELVQLDDEESPALAADEAWTIYRFFIASGSAYEVSLEYAHRKRLMESLAKPTLETFSEVKKSALTMLRSDFERYKATDEYKGLASLLRSRKQAADREKVVSSSSLSAFNCFGK